MDCSVSMARREPERRRYFATLVAGIVANRAEAMAKFADPGEAFEHSGEKLEGG